MSTNRATVQQHGCSCVNMLVPVFMLAGALLGWRIGSPYGTIYAVLAAGAGLVLGIPACGLVLLAIVSICMLPDRLARGRSGADEDTSPTHRPEV